MHYLHFSQHRYELMIIITILILSFRAHNTGGLGYLLKLVSSRVRTSGNSLVLSELASSSMKWDNKSLRKL